MCQLALHQRSVLQSQYQIAMMHHKSNAAANTLLLELRDELHYAAATCTGILGDIILDSTMQETCDSCNKLLPKSSHSGLFNHGPKHTVVCGLEHRPACQQCPVFSLGACATSSAQHPVLYACKESNYPKNFPQVCSGDDFVLTGRICARLLFEHQPQV